MAKRRIKHLSRQWLKEVNLKLMFCLETNQIKKINLISYKIIMKVTPQMKKESTHTHAEKM